MQALLRNVMGKLGVLALALAGTCSAQAQSDTAAVAADAASFPQKPIRIIAPYPAGGSVDVISRGIGQKLTEYWGQPVIVENRPGASGWLGLSIGARAPADGYTFVLTLSNPVYAHLLYNELPFNMQRDFAPVSMVTKAAIGLVAPKNAPYNTVDELIAYAAKNKGAMSYASFGQGTTAHVFGESLNLHKGIDMVHVPYGGAGPMVLDLLGGQVSLAWLDVAGILPLLENKIKVLAVTGSERSPHLPDVPTFKETGIPDFETVGFFLVLAPAATPPAILDKLSQGIHRAVTSEDLGKQFQLLGFDPVGSTPADLQVAMDALVGDMDKAIKATGIKVE